MIQIVIRGYFKYYNEKYNKIYLEIDKNELYKIKQHTKGNNLNLPYKQFKTCNTAYLKYNEKKYPVDDINKYVNNKVKVQLIVKYYEFTKNDNVIAGYSLILEKIKRINN